MQIALPRMRNCNTAFLQQILKKEKKYYYEYELSGRAIPKYAELGVYHILTHKYLKESVVKNYFPNNPLRVDREWLWKLWLKTDINRAEKYLQKVENER